MQKRPTINAKEAYYKERELQRENCPTTCLEPFSLLSVHRDFGATHSKHTQFKFVKLGSDTVTGTTGGGPGRPLFWRTLEESCKGLGSVTFKINTQHTHCDCGNPESVCVCRLFIFKVTGQAPYGARSAFAKRAAYPDPQPVVPDPEEEEEDLFVCNDTIEGPRAKPESLATLSFAYSRSLLHIVGLF